MTIQLFFCAILITSPRKAGFSTIVRSMIFFTAASQQADVSRRSRTWSAGPKQCSQERMNTDFREKVLQVLASVAETEEVRTNLELPLYECQLLDSIKTVELMIGIEEEFGLKISPSEFERENWETPRKIIADLERRIQVNA